MKHFFLLKEYFKYLFTASSAHGIHSPFVFDFIETVLKDKRDFYAFEEIEKFRKKMYHDSKVITVEDLGAGSLHAQQLQREVKDIAKNAGRNEKFGKLLFRIVDKFQRKNILELGTSLGLGTHYLAMANKTGNVTTIEGSQEIAKFAASGFAESDLNNIVQETGNFDDVLDDVLQKNKPFDLIFIDGNHREEPTIRYFKQVLPFINEDCILIFDDIHWSSGMKKAWETILADQQVRLSINLFFVGMVFFRTDFKEKQHFTLKY